MSNFYEFFDYLRDNIDASSMWFGFFTCMLFDAIFSLDSFFLEKAFDLFAKRKSKYLKGKDTSDNGKKSV